MPYKDLTKRREHHTLRARIRRAALTEEERKAEYQRKKPVTDAWIEANREKRRAWFRRWYHERNGKEKQAERNGKPETLEYCRRKDLRRFGITLEQYNDLLSDQDGVCAVCGNLNKDGRGLAVDHCHKSGRVRGLLCNKCNRGLGFFDDDCERMMRAIEYILNDREGNE